MRGCGGGGALRQSLHLLRWRLCSQIWLPPHSLHVLRTRLCSQIELRRRDAGAARAAAMRAGKVDGGDGPGACRSALEARPWERSAEPTPGQIPAAALVPSPG